MLLQNIIQLHGCVWFKIWHMTWAAKNLENKKKLTPMWIMNSVDVFSENIVNNVGTFSDDVAMNSIFIE